MKKRTKKRKTQKEQSLNDSNMDGKSSYFRGKNKDLARTKNVLRGIRQSFRKVNLRRTNLETSGFQNLGIKKTIHRETLNKSKFTCLLSSNKPNLSFIAFPPLCLVL